MKSLLLPFSILSLTACFTEPQDREFIITVDSMRVPTAVSGNAPFDVAFFGRIGGNGCVSFKEYRLNKSSALADITLIGVDASKGRTCPDNVPTLNGIKVTISPPVTDPFELRVRQPRNEILSRIIRVE